MQNLTILCETLQILHPNVHVTKIILLGTKSWYVQESGNGNLLCLSSSIIGRLGFNLSISESYRFKPDVSIFNVFYVLQH